MNKEALDLTSDTRDAVQDLIEILDRDFSLKEAPYYRRRNLIRAIYWVARAGAVDSHRSAGSVCDAILSVREGVIEKLVQEGDPNA